MTSNPKSPNNNHPASAQHPNSLSASHNLIQRDRFELLSAYMDGEVTAAERKQVEEWLTNDPTVQRLHARLLKLRQGLHTLPVPPLEQSVEQTVDNVLNRVDRRPKLSLVWGGTAIAALFMGALVQGLPLLQESGPQLATTPQQATQTAQATASAELLIALDKPLVAIPKTPVAPAGSQTGIQPNLSESTH